jgi:hypothetical protein
VVKAVGRALALAPNDALATWLAHALSRANVTLQIARTLNEVIAALVDDPSSRPQLLIADFDALDAGQVLHLHTIRERGWFGTIIALGSVSPDLQKSLSIERVVPRPLDGDALRKAVDGVGLVKATTKMMKLKRD